MSALLGRMTLDEKVIPFVFATVRAKYEGATSAEDEAMGEADGVDRLASSATRP